MKRLDLRLPISAARLAQPRLTRLTSALAGRSALTGHVALALLVVAGIALRLWLISFTPLDPRFSNADDGDYYQRALRLAVTGQYIDDAWLIRPPLHVFFFAAWLRVALALGQPQLGVLLVQLAQTGVAALTVLAGYGAARRLFASERAGLIFAAFLALWFPFIEAASVLFSELLYLFLFLTHLWLLLRFDSSGRLRDLALSGLALGLAALTRSPALYSLAFVVGWLVLRQLGAKSQAARTEGGARERSWPATLRACAVVVACCLAVVGPWTLRNYLVYQRFIPVDTLGQINLWLDLDSVSKRVENIETLRRLPQADRHLYALERAREILAADPLRPFRPMWSTFRHIWKAQYIEDYYVKQSFFTRPLSETAAIGLIGDAMWLVATGAGLWGLAGALREGLHNRLFFLAWIGYSLLTVLIFHVEPRYLLPLWTLLALYGAGTLANVKGKRQKAKGSASFALYLLPFALVVAFVALLVTYRDYPAIIAAGAARERAMAQGDRAYAEGNYAAAEQAYRAALDAQPAFVDAQVRLALALAAQGRHEEAAAALDRNSSRRTELVFGAIARDRGDEATASAVITRIEAIAGEDVQRWALSWLRPPPADRVGLGSGLDIGYIEGFSAGERDATRSFRWLTGAGRVVLPLPEPIEPGAAVELRLTSGREGLTPLTVQVGDGPAWQLPVAGGEWRVYRIPVPLELAGRQQIEVRLRAPTFVPALEHPGSTDSRALSLMVSEVAVR